MIIDGKKEAEKVLTQLQNIYKNVPKLSLALIAVGDIKEIGGFIASKKKIAEKLNVDFRLYQLPNTLSREQLRHRITQIVRSTANGVVVQLPLPDRYDAQYFLNAIIPEKDVDCLSAKCTGLFFTDKTDVLPPAVETVKYLLKTWNIDIMGTHAVVVGYGALVGKPTAHFLLKNGATVSVVNSKTSSMLKQELLERADIIVSGVGKAHVVDACKKGSVIIDFGYAREGNTVCGDVDTEKLKNIASFITPTPGGTGPLLVAMLYQNLRVLKMKNLK